MKKIGYVLGLILLISLLSVFLLGMALSRWVDPNGYKMALTERLYAQTQLHFAFDGPITWELFPWPRIQLEQVRVVAPLQSKAFVEADRILLSIKLWPLLHHILHIDQAQIDGLVIDLTTNIEGKNNWAFFTETQSLANAPENLIATTTPRGTHAKVRLDMDQLLITNAQLTYQNHQTQQRYSLENLTVKAGAIREGVPVALEIHAAISTTQPALQGQFALHTKLRFDRALVRYQAENTLLEAQLQGSAWNNQPLQLKAQGAFLFDQPAGVAEWNNLQLSVNQLTVLGAIKLYDLDNTPNLSGELSVATFDAEAWLSDLGVKLPAGVEANPLRQLSLTTRLSGSGNSVAFEELKMQLAGTKATGRIAITDWLKRSINIELSLDQLNLDAYLPNTVNQAAVLQTTSAQQPAEAKLPLWSETPLLVPEALRTLLGQLSLTIERLIYRAVPLEQFVLKANIGAGVLRLEHVESRLAKGHWDAQASLDLHTEVPKVQLALNLHQLPISSLLRLAQTSAPISGYLDTQLQLNTQGVHQRALVAALQGSGQLSVAEGLLLGTQLDQQLCTAIAEIKNLPLSHTVSTSDTVIQELNVPLTIKQGQIYTDPVNIRTASTAMHGRGVLNLNTLAMDYRLDVQITGDQSQSPDPTCQPGATLAQMQWPLECVGPVRLGAQNCRFDNDAFKALIREKLLHKLQQQLPERSEVPHPLLREALRGILHR